MLVNNFLSPILNQQWVSSSFQYVGDIIGKGLNLTGIPYILGYSPGEDDYKRLRLLRDSLLKEQGSVEKTTKHVLQLLNDGKLTAVEYGVLIKLLYRKDDASGGDVVISRITAMGKNWVDMGFLPTYYLSRVIGWYYIYNQYSNFFWQIFYVVQYVWACLSWGQLSLAYGIVVIVLYLLNRAGNVVGLGEKRETVLSHLISPFTTLFRLVYNNTHTSMFLVALIYKVISYVDASNNLLGKVDAISSATMGLKGEKEELWEREVVKKEVERILDEQTSPVLPDQVLDKGATIILDELTLFANGSTQDIGELSEKITQLISIY